MTLTDADIESTLRAIDSKLDHIVTLNRVSVRLILSAYRHQGGLSEEQYNEILEALQETESKIDGLG